MASSREKCNLQEQHCFLFIFTLLKGHFSSAVPSTVGGSCDMGSEVIPKTNPSHPSFSPQDAGSIRSWQLTPAGLKQFTSISGIKIIKKCSILAGKSAWAEAGVPQPGLSHVRPWAFCGYTRGAGPWVQWPEVLSQRQISCGPGHLNMFIYSLCFINSFLPQEGRQSYVHVCSPLGAGTDFPTRSEFK